MYIHTHTYLQVHMCISCTYVYVPDLSDLGVVPKLSYLGLVPNLSDLGLLADLSDLDLTPNLFDLALAPNLSDLGLAPNLSDLGLAPDLSDLDSAPPLGTKALGARFGDKSARRPLWGQNGVMKAARLGWTSVFCQFRWTSKHLLVRSAKKILWCFLGLGT